MTTCFAFVFWFSLGLKTLEDFPFHPPLFDGLHNDSTGASYGSGVDTETTIHTEITSTQANTPLHMHNFPLSHPTHYSTD